MYDQLTIKKWINGWDTISSMGGSLMERETVDAMSARWRGNRHDDDMTGRAGARIAAMTRNEAACVMGGASAGLLCSVYTAIRERGCRDVVMMCSHRNHYDHAVRMAGGTIRQVGLSWMTEEWEIKGALGERPAALLFAASEKHARFGLPLARCVELSHEAGVPVIVDAAAQLPPAENLWRYTGEGADIVLFSGGKAIKGPQSIGFAVGKREWIEKIDRLRTSGHELYKLVSAGESQAAALLVALETFVCEEGEEQRYAQTRHRAERIARRLVERGGVGVRVLPVTPIGQKMYGCEVEWPGPITAGELQARLKDERGIRVGTRPGEAAKIMINPFALNEEECVIVADAVSDLCGRGEGPKS